MRDVQKKIWVTLGLFLLLFTSSDARPFGFNSFSMSDKKIKLMLVQPDSAYAFRVFSDTSITFYFDRKDWISELKKISADTAQNEEYIALLDSIQQQNSVIEISTLPNYDPMLNRISPVGTSWTIFEILLPHGEVFARYSNGTCVTEMKTKKTKVSTWKMTEFIDASSGKVLYRYSRNNRPGF